MLVGPGYWSEGHRRGFARQIHDVGVPLLQGCDDLRAVVRGDMQDADAPTAKMDLTRDSVERTRHAPGGVSLSDDSQYDFTGPRREPTFVRKEAKDNQRLQISAETLAHGDARSRDRRNCQGNEQQTPVHVVSDARPSGMFTPAHGAPCPTRHTPLRWPHESPL